MSQSYDEMKALLAGAPERKSGRAVFDQGRTVWEWQTATGVFERHVSDEQMSRLEASDLRLADQAPAIEGCAIYGSTQVGRNQRAASDRAFASRRQAAPRGGLRQFWRRLVPPT
jgi:hypothetical protein